MDAKNEMGEKEITVLKGLLALWSEGGRGGLTLRTEDALRAGQSGKELIFHDAE